MTYQPEVYPEAREKGKIRLISENHPEMKNCISWILETIENPDLILTGDFGELIATKLFKKNTCHK